MIHSRHRSEPTGEIFVMCTSKDWLLELMFASRRKEQGYYDALRATIENCGGQLITKKVASTENMQDRVGMYPRDVGIVLPKNGEPVLFTPQHYGTASRTETRHLVRIAEKHKLAKEESIPGRVEGGNMVYDAARHVLFVGVSNHHQVKPYHDVYARNERGGDGEVRRVYRDPLEYIAPEQRADFVRARIDLAAPTRKWLAAAREQLPALPTGDGEKKIRVVPLFMPDKDIDRFYHLDGVFNMLPSGQAVMCPAAMSKAAKHMVERAVGSENIITIDADAAERGATNFITVGKHIITPYASTALKATLEKLGYDVVDPPAVGLPDNAWRFNHGAFVRCATLKMTPDMGFPQAEKNRGTEAAVPSFSQR